VAGKAKRVELALDGLEATTELAGDVRRTHLVSSVLDGDRVAEPIARPAATNDGLIVGLNRYNRKNSIASIMGMSVTRQVTAGKNLGKFRSDLREC